MAEHTNIEWTDATWNVVTGCTKVSPGCANCYIERTTPFRMRGRTFVHGSIPLQFHEGRLAVPLHWKKARRIFVNSLSDLFHEDVPDIFIDRVFAVMALAPQHTFQILTKRAERMRLYVASRTVGDRLHADIASVVHVDAAALNAVERWHATNGGDGFIRWPLRNVWLGVSVENQHFADERIPLLLQMPAAVRFISAEPLLGPLDIRHGLHLTWTYSAGPSDHIPPSPEIVGGWWSDLGTMPHDQPKLDWVIVGGESGPHSRGCDIAWIRSLVAQCTAAGVACFVKQLGTYASDGLLTAEEMVLGGAGRPRPFDQPLSHVEAAAILADIGVDAMRRILPLRNKKGGDPLEWPLDLRVRQFPKGVAVESHA